MTNECSACRLFFGSIKAFDSHRVGDFPQTGPADWLDRIRAGLADPLDDWQPTEQFGRRCLDEAEMDGDVRFARGQNGWTLARHVRMGRELSEGRRAIPERQ